MSAEQEIRARNAAAAVLAETRTTSPSDRYVAATDAQRAEWSRSAHSRGLSTVDYLRGLDEVAVRIEQDGADVRDIVAKARRRR